MMGGPPQNQIFSYLGHPDKNSRNSKGPTRIMASKEHLQDYFPFSNDHSNFVYVYFLFSYYLLLAPFRLRKLDNGKFEIYSWFPQKLLCGFATALAILRLGTSVRNSLEKLKTNDPLSFFLMFSEVSSFIFKLTMFKGFWTKAEAHLRLVNYVNNYYILPYNPYKMESMTTLGFMYGAYVTLSFLRFSFGSGSINIWDWSPQWWYRRSVSEARYTFFLINGTNIATAPAMEDITSIDNFFMLVHCLSLLFRYIVAFFVDLCILIHVWTLWAPTSAFTNSKHSEIAVLQGNNMDVEEALSYEVRSGRSLGLELDAVVKQFDALKNLSVLIEDAIGDAICPFIGEALFFYAVYFDDVLLTKDLVKRFVLIFFYTSAVCIIVFSSEIVRKIRWLKSWLCEHGRLQIIEQNRLSMILDDLSKNSVGISASGIFTINYSFIGTFVSVLITYFIIRLQSGNLG